MRYLGSVIFLGLAIFGAVQWRRRGWRIPLIVHLLGLVGLALGVWMAWLDYSVAQFQFTRAVLEVGLMPLLVYIGFFAYSSRLIEQRDEAGKESDDQAAV
jgi:hypothetical protein